MRDALKAARAALAELLAFETEPAGFDSSLVETKGGFSAFIDAQGAHKDRVIAQTRTAIAAADAALAVVADERALKDATPGDWRVGNTYCTHDHPTRYWRTNIGNGEAIAQTFGATLEEAEANARLIVAARSRLSAPADEVEESSQKG